MLILVCLVSFCLSHLIFPIVAQVSIILVLLKTNQKTWKAIHLYKDSELDSKDRFKFLCVRGIIKKYIWSLSRVPTTEL